MVREVHKCLISPCWTFVAGRIPSRATHSTSSVVVGTVLLPFLGGEEHSSVSCYRRTCKWFQWVPVAGNPIRDL